MENKKLLKYLLKDLSELDEMFAESGKVSFDEMELEFIKNRISGAKGLVKLFLEKENEIPSEIDSETVIQQKEDLHNVNLPDEKLEIKAEEKTQVEEIPEKKATSAAKENVPGVVAQEISSEHKLEEKVPEITEERIHVVENNIKAPDIVRENKVEIQEQKTEGVPKQTASLKNDSTQQEMQMDDEEPVDIHNKRLGDSFLKEKSVNDLMSGDSSKLEHKLSNRPVSSIQSAIGINDRFQYIRELFEGSADNFVKAVSDLDSMEDIKEAVDYLQTNFKWKKNDTSLKFINLIKRRFPHE